MPDLVNVNYDRTGKSTSTNELGMREMQERAFQSRNKQYILLKSPPASGKSRVHILAHPDTGGRISIHVRQNTQLLGHTTEGMTNVYLEGHNNWTEVKAD